MKRQLLSFTLSLLFFGMPAVAGAEEHAIWPGVAPGMVNPPADEEVTGQGSGFANVSKPTLTTFYAEKPSGAAVLVLPGGGYDHVVFGKEGTEIAAWFNTIGIDAYVLKYRLPKDTFNPATSAYQDAQRAIRLIRSGTVGQDRHTDPKRIGVIGFSAGGHLAAVVGTYHETNFYDPIDASDGASGRPNFMILGYPMIYPREFLRDHGGTHRQSEIMETYAFEKAVNASTPPAFIFAGQRDRKVPYTSSVFIAQLLDKARVPVELHIFPGSDHGFALRGTGEEKVWPELCVKWLRAGGIIPAN